MSKINFIIAEKSYLIRAGIIGIIETFSGCDVVDEITETKHLSKKIVKLKPDILIINFDFYQSIKNEINKSEFKQTTIVVLLNNEQQKDSTYPDSVQTIKINDDKSVISKTIRDLIRTRKPIESDKNPDLSEREKEIIARVAGGKTNKEIAEELFISTHTVVTHRKNIVRKLGIRTVSGLTVYAILNKLISITDIQTN